MLDTPPQQHRKGKVASWANCNELVRLARVGIMRVERLGELCEHSLTVMGLLLLGVVNGESQIIYHYWATKRNIARVLSKSIGDSIKNNGGGIRGVGGAFIH